MGSKLHLGGALGLIFIGVEGFITFSMLKDLYSDYVFANSEFSSDSYNFSIKWQDIYFIVLGIGYVLSGSALLSKAKWGRQLSSLVLLASMVGWIYIVYTKFFKFPLPTRGHIWVELGLTVFVFVLLLWGLLFLGNDKVKEDFGDEDKDFWEDNILDA